MGRKESQELVMDWAVGQGEPRVNRPLNFVSAARWVGSRLWRQQTMEEN